jgi:hypothetical protein
LKVKGRELERYAGEFTCIRKVPDFDPASGGDPMELIRIKIRALPSSWAEEAAKHLPLRPQPPLGKVATKDPQTGNMVRQPDEEDPDYKRAILAWERLFYAKKIHDATEDEGIEWETQLEGVAYEKFYAGIADELDASFSRGEVSQWALAIDGIGQVGGADIAIAAQSMFQGQAFLDYLRAIHKDQQAGPVLPEVPRDAGEEGVGDLEELRLGGLG